MSTFPTKNVPTTVWQRSTWHRDALYLRFAEISFSQSWLLLYIFVLFRHRIHEIVNSLLRLIEVPTSPGFGVFRQKLLYYTDAEGTFVT